MLALGIILLLLAGLLVLGVLAGGAGEITLELGVVSVQASVFAVFLLGAVAVLLVVLGAGLVRIGLRRATRQRRDAKNAKQLQRMEERGEQPAREGHAGGRVAPPPTGTSATTEPPGR